MTTDNIEHTSDFGNLIRKGGLEVPDINFDDKVMDRVFLSEIKKKSLKKNLRLSWIFLVVSCIMFPLAYYILSKIEWTAYTAVGKHISSFSKSISMAGIVIFSIVIFLQLDNLFRLSFKQKAY